MFGFARHRIRLGRGWIAAAIVVGVVLLALLLVVNVAGQGYTEEWFRSSTFIPPSSSFPANFLRGSLANRSSCEPLLIRQGDGTFALPRSPRFTLPLSMAAVIV
jgi:hypothetical protein